MDRCAARARIATDCTHSPDMPPRIASSPPLLDRRTTVVICLLTFTYLHVFGPWSLCCPQVPHQDVDSSARGSVRRAGKAGSRCPLLPICGQVPGPRDALKHTRATPATPLLPTLLCSFTPMLLFFFVPMLLGCMTHASMSHLSLIHVLCSYMVGALGNTTEALGASYRALGASYRALWGTLGGIG